MAVTMPYLSSDRANMQNKFNVRQIMILAFRFCLGANESRERVSGHLALKKKHLSSPFGFDLV